ncbi:MAG: hypothetical protein AUK47_01635 [Deltaproteobacteria bacterium CG2_30_63_29]|nr:MAG: hypothetical protein AUK47_01635 [Deltaproteobacteria bacterium CG2_30_63_29]
MCSTVWSLRSLGDLVEVLDHLRVPINSDERAKRLGDVPYYGANGQQGWIDKALFNESLILLTEDGGNFDEFRSRPIAYRINGPAWVNNHAHIVRALFGVDQDFVFWSVVNRDIRRYIAGGTRSKLTQGELRTIELMTPPLPEQRRIAEILDTLDAAIRQTEAVIAKLSQVKQGLLHDLLTRGIDGNGELRRPVEEARELYRETELGWVPREWGVERLADLAEVRSGIAKNSNKAVSNPVWVHYLRVANVQDGYLDLTEMSQIRVSHDDVERYVVLPGDVLMNEGGDLDKLGRGAVWRGQFTPCVHQNHVFVVRCGHRLLSDYLDSWTGSAPARRYFMVAGKQTTNLASINKTALGRLPVAVPGLREQAGIVEALALQQEQVDREQELFGKLRTLKQGLMDDLLTGNVRVDLR